MANEWQLWGCLWSLSSNTSSLLPCCCISILGRPHLPPESKNSGGLPPAVTSHPQSCTSSMENTDHTYSISSLPQVSGLLCPESHGIQHLLLGQTSSLAHPSLLPLLRVLSGLHGASLLLGQCQKGQHSERAAPSLTSQGCPESSVHCSSKITPLSNFKTSTHHYSSLEQK